MTKGWLGQRDEWERLHKYLLTQEEVGLDTESQEAEEGTAGSRDLYVWSIAGFSLKDGKRIRHPRGYDRATGFTLPREALETFRPLLESESITKWVHNAPADTRPIFDNAGIILKRARCTLQHSRVAMPNLGGYGLKFLAQCCLGKPARDTYLEVVSYLRSEYKTKTKKTKKLCTCGVPGCKKRIGHFREVVEETTIIEKVVEDRYNQADLIPGHPRFERWVKYALDDAVDALELASFLRSFKDRRPGDPFDPKYRNQARGLCGVYD